MGYPFPPSISLSLSSLCFVLKRVAFQIRRGDGETEQAALLGTAADRRNFLGGSSTGGHSQISRTSAPPPPDAIHILLPQFALFAHGHADEPSARVHVVRAVPTLRTWYRNLASLHVSEKGGEVKREIIPRRTTTTTRTRTRTANNSLVCEFLHAYPSFHSIQFFFSNRFYR